MGFLSSITKGVKSLVGGATSAVKGISSSLSGVMKAGSGGGIGGIASSLVGAIPGIGPLLSPLVGAVGGLAAENIGGIAGYFGQQAANDANSAQALRSMEFTKDQAQQQMAFQERMRNSAYQASMQDMKNAGLNPILAYKMGGASVPSGASGSGAQGVIQNLANSAFQTKMLKSQQKLIEKQWDAVAADESQKLTQAGLNMDNARSVKLSNDVKEIETDFIKNNPWILKGKILAELAGSTINAGSSALDLVPPFRRGYLKKGNINIKGGKK